MRPCYMPEKLDVDPTIRDKQLNVITDDENNRYEDRLAGELQSAVQTNVDRLCAEADTQQLQATLDQLVNLTTAVSEGGQLPDYLVPIEVTPEPGLCVKTTNVDGQKVFVNLCTVCEIPPPPGHVTEDLLKRVISEQDYDADFRIPMSIAEPRMDVDHAGTTCHVCDVAVNRDWFRSKVANSVVFTTFVVQVAMEGIHDRYAKSTVNMDRQNWKLMTNKKAKGKLGVHKIQRRASGTTIQEIVSASDRPPAEVSKQDVKSNTAKARDASDHIRISEADDIGLSAVKTVRKRDDQTKFLGAFKPKFEMYASDEPGKACLEVIIQMPASYTPDPNSIQLQMVNSQLKVQLEPSDYNSWQVDTRMPIESGIPNASCLADVRHQFKDSDLHLYFTVDMSS